ncbi:MAG TPA: bifunctional phosphoglucose/phosphomannose isomerase [archaeon]|nr:bifunctional phosphoglucose/phosphomannose isomerase [archaeon]
MKWQELQKSFDRQRVFDFIWFFPDQIRQIVRIADSFPIEIRAEIQKIVFCGMGGSGIGGRIVKKLVEKEIKVPIELVSDYSLPEFVDEKTLVVAVSYSGNTEETIACAEEAKKKSAVLVAITSGGKISQLVEKKITVPKAPQPRMAQAFLIVPILFMLSKRNFIKNKETELKNCADFLEKQKSKIQAEAQKIALKLEGKFPVIYAESRLEAIAYRFRCELNENAKVLAMHHEFPEMNHNEINSEFWPKNSCLVFLRGKNESVQMKKRFEFVKKTFKNIPQQEIILQGGNEIEENFYGVFLFSMASYFLALLNKKNPNAVPAIEKLKEELARQP